MNYFRLLTGLLVLLFAKIAHAAFAIFMVNGAPTPIVLCDITTGVATGVGAGTCASPTATCNGVADDAPAFAAFNTWAVGTWQASHTGLIGLSVPSGKSCTITGTTIACPNNNHVNCPFIGIKQLAVIGFGASIDVANTSTLGGVGLYQDNLHSARLATVAAGSSCVTLLTTAQTSLFTIGNYAEITGFDLQGEWQSPAGFPPNPQWFEYVKVSSINAGTGVICFSAALNHTYKSTWPNFNSGSSTQVDNGGPATLYALDPSWDAEIEFRGLTVNDSNQSTVYAKNRIITYRNVVFSGQACPTPTETLLFQAINTSMSPCAPMEVDKLIGTINFVNSSIGTITFQSSSTDLFSVTGGSISLVQGTPKKFIGSNATIADLRPGALSYGRSDEATCTNCAVASFTAAGLTTGATVGNAGVNNRWTMSGTTITIPNTQSVDPDLNQVRWAAPGTWFCWDGTQECQAIAQVVDVTQDATNTYVQLDRSYPGGSFPPVPLTAGILDIRVHPAPKFSCSGCIGAAGAILATYPVGSPLFSYATASYTGAIGATAQVLPKTWGNVSSISLNMTNAYGGAGALQFHMVQFDNMPVIKSDYSGTTYGPNINAKIAGNRQITLSTVTGSQTGDAGLAVPDAVMTWLTGSATPAFSADVSGSCPGANCPAVTVTIQTDQGITP